MTRCGSIIWSIDKYSRLSLLTLHLNARLMIVFAVPIFTNMLSLLTLHLKRLKSLYNQELVGYCWKMQGFDGLDGWLEMDDIVGWQLHIMQFILINYDKVERRETHPYTATVKFLHSNKEWNLSFLVSCPRGLSRNLSICIFICSSSTALNLNHAVCRGLHWPSLFWIAPISSVWFIISNRSQHWEENTLYWTLKCTVTLGLGKLSLRPMKCVWCWRTERASNLVLVTAFLNDWLWMKTRSNCDIWNWSWATIQDKAIFIHYIFFK